MRHTRPASILHKLLILLFFYSPLLNAAAVDTLMSPYTPHSLAWPIPIKDNTDQFGKLMHQVGRAGDKHYYHSGVDLIAPALQPVKTPVTGRIEGSFYTYEDHDDGSSTITYHSLKAFLNGENLPWDDDEFKYYFEIAVIDAHGTRFEFHHINPDNLPQQIIDAILSENRVDAGATIGFIMESPWIPTPHTHGDVGAQHGLPHRHYYAHLHYSVRLIDGTYVNPLLLSRQVPDDTSPVLYSVHGVQFGFCGDQKTPILNFGLHLTEGDTREFLFTEKYLAVDAEDQIANSSFANPPSKVIVQIGGLQEPIVWEQTKYLQTKQNKFPDIRDQQVLTACLYMPGVPTTMYRPHLEIGRQLIKIPLPESVLDNTIREATITVFDFAGNRSTQTIKIKASPK